jgi:HPt (histidine-containing phosphotransfer) domain-containing protein
MAAKETMESVPIDFDKTLERAMGDQEFLEKILQQFIADLPRQMKILETALMNTDSETLAKQAHALKGAAANLGADDMSATAWKLEQLGKAGDLNVAKLVLKDMEKETLRLCDYVNKFI